MSNRQLIKSAHIWALALILAGGLWAIAGKAGVKIQDQNSNQNQNGNGNTNTGNANRTQNANANRSNANRSNANQSANRNSRNNNATGEQTGMATMSSQDRDFLMQAAIDGLMEVELGRLAVQQGASDAVKQFGQRMVDDHTQANTELMTLASSKGITLPTQLDEKHRAHVTKFSGMSGAEFDRAYGRHMATAHKKDVASFERQSNRGADPDLKAFATKTLPTLQQHLQMAQSLPGAEGGRGNDNMNSNTGGAGNSNRNRNGNSNNSNRP